MKIQSDSLRPGLRGHDVAARYGGDEFLLILPETGIEAACIVAERLRKLVAETDFRSAAGDEVRVTISGGETCCDGEATGKRRTIKTVDNALYQSKQQGCNRSSVIPLDSGVRAAPGGYSEPRQQASRRSGQM